MMAEWFTTSLWSRAGSFPGAGSGDRGAESLGGWDHMAGSRGLTKVQAQPRVIVMPAELGVANANLVGEQLGSAFGPGVTVVIADMTDTIHCDSWGVRMLVLAHKRATANHAELRLAVP